jgi:hypothetical protein
MVADCEHIKKDGKQCGSPAMKGKLHCYYHVPQPVDHVPQVRVRFFLELPRLETKRAIQAALRSVMRAVVANQVDLADAGRLLHALTLASSTRPAPAPAGNSRSYTISSVKGLPNIFATQNSIE